MKELEQLLSEGQLDSSGSFTLSRDEALRKLANYNLPRPQAFVLKLIQAGVLGGASGIQISQLRSSLRVNFEGLTLWTPEDFQEHLFSPASTPHPSLEKLRQALWHQNLRHGREIQVHLPKGCLQIRDKNCHPKKGHTSSNSSRIEIALDDPERPWHRTSQVSRLHQEIAEELKVYAFTCPIPLLLDRRRLDGLQACPTHGYGKIQCPFYLGFSLEGGKPLKLPPGSLSGYKPPLKSVGQTRFEVEKAPEDGLVSAAALLSYTVEQLGDHRWWWWSTSTNPTLVYWVCHGVVTGQEPLLCNQVLSVSLALFASSEGLEHELDGLTLRTSSNSVILQRRQIRLLLNGILSRARLNLSWLIGWATVGGAAMGTVLMTLGVASSSLIPVKSVLACTGGLFYLGRAGANERKLSTQLQDELNQLRKSFLEWQ